MSTSSKELQQFLTLDEIILLCVHSHYKLQLDVFIKTTHMMTIAPNFGKLKRHFQVLRCPETKNLVSLLVHSHPAAPPLACLVHVKGGHLLALLDLCTLELHS